VPSPSDARRSSPSSDAVLDRLNRLHPKIIDLGLDRVEDILRRLGDPHRSVAPVVHFAGTNGKGSTIAFLRAMLEAQGRRVQTYTSPHLVRFHERVRLTYGPIAEDTLVALLEYCESVNESRPITYFEITTVAAFCAFAADKADVLLLETGLGGRLDATNVLKRPLATVITPISLDHVQFLGNSIGEIAFEKAGILKYGVPAIVGPQPPRALEVVEKRARELSAPLFRFGHEWRFGSDGDGVIYEDDRGELRLPPPALIGPHQVENAGLAVAAARHLGHLSPSSDALARGLASADWPARLQRLRRGVLVEHLCSTSEEGWELWLDGGHNESAGQRLAEVLADWDDRPTHLVYGMMNTKSARGYLLPLAPRAASLTAITIPGETNALSAADAAAEAEIVGLRATPADSLVSAIGRIVREEAPGRILICGSLYLAGHALTLNG
jgi:dihydrofolate synthase/folylpolyglutamate synthase